MSRFGPKVRVSLRRSILGILIKMNLTERRDIELILSGADFGIGSRQQSLERTKQRSLMDL